MPSSSIYAEHLELPGYFRPEKKWDLVVVDRGELLAAVEFKSQVGPSFGNNFNNRTEEAIGTAHDLWVAFREGAFPGGQRPWLGYLMMLEDCPKSNAPVTGRQPHFTVFPEFKGTSYSTRYQLLLTKLVRERLYDGACFITSAQASGLRGQYAEPNSSLAFDRFLASFGGRIAAHLALR